MDDLHWADAASVDLLLHVCRMVEDSSLLILLSMRPERASPGWRIKEVLERTLPHRLTTLEIEPLSEESSNELLTVLVGDRRIEPELAGIVLDRGSGNPLFLEELTLELGKQRKTDDDTQRELPVPDSLQSLMAARIDHLDQESRATLQRAAIIGRSFPVDILEEIDPAGRDVSQNLNVLERSGLIQETQRVPERQYTFRHDLMRETAIRSVLRRQRRAIHRQIAVALEAMRSDRIGDVAHQIALHYAQAGEIDQAVHFSVLAGERARNLYALDEAILDFTTALEMLGKHDPQSALHQQLLYDRGSARVIVGDFENAQQDLEDSRSLARVSGDRHAEWRALIRLGDLWTGRDYNKAGEYFELALKMAESIDDQHILARSKVQIANWQLNNALAAKAIATFRRPPSWA
jgi:predicted ATPase